MVGCNVLRVVRHAPMVSRDRPASSTATRSEFRASASTCLASTRLKPASFAEGRTMSIISVGYRRRTNLRRSSQIVPSYARPSIKVAAEPRLPRVPSMVPTSGIGWFETVWRSTSRKSRNGDIMTPSWKRNVRRGEFGTASPSGRGVIATASRSMENPSIAPTSRARTREGGLRRIREVTLLHQQAGVGLTG